MRFVIAALIMVLTCGSVTAHELTPTYPQLETSLYNGVLQTEMLLFNRREDVSYYQIEVYDKDWNPVPFATEEKILKVNYLDRVNFLVYIKQSDAGRVTYICTRSKILKGEDTSVIASNICSKIK